MFLLDVVFGGLLAGGLRNPWAFAAAAALLWGTASLKRPSLSASPAVSGLWLAWLGWTACSALLSAEPLRAAAAAAYPATGLLVYFWAGAWNAAYRRRWLWLLLTSGTVLAAAAFCVKTPSRPMIGLLYPYANYTPLFLAAVFSAAAAAITAQPRLPARRLWPAAVALLAFSVILAAKSRGALVAAGVGAAYVLWRSGHRRTFGLLAAAGVLALTLVPNSVLQERFKLDHLGAHMRPAMWAAAADIAREHPLFGEGPGLFERGFLRRNIPSPEGHRPTRFGLRSRHAHSEPLQMAAETGWPGMILFLLAFAATFLRGRAKPDAARLAARAVVISLFTAALYDNIFALPALQWIFFSALAAGTECSTPRLRLRAPRPLLLLGLALVLYAPWPDWLIGRRRELAFHSRGAEAVRWMGSALAMAPDSADLWADMARLHLRAGRPAAMLEALAEAEKRDPTNATYPLMAGEIFRTAARWDRVLLAAHRALTLEPVCPPGELLAAEALWHTGNRNGAAEHLRRAARPLGGVELYAPYDRMIRTLDHRRYAELRRLIGG
ncbi:MAG: O-antigen ligase family protein [Elusimicrobiota bacterium]